MSSLVTLLALPSELIEAILICSESPRTVATIAQTCRTFHTLVYGSPDSHLWRELFLATWDDPRPALDHRVLVDPRIHPATWDWGTEYRSRVSADRWLKAWRRNICLADDSETPKDANPLAEWRTTSLSVLSTILDTLLTLQPFPATPPIALKVLTPVKVSPYPTGNIGSGVGDRRERMTNAPPMPPLLIVTASGISAFDESRSGVRLGRMIYGPHASRVLGGGGLGETVERAPIPTPSLPPQLVRTLLPSHAINVRGLPAYTPFLSAARYWGGDPLGDVFHRIICITGFVPIPPPLTSTSTCALDTAPEFVSDRAASADMEGLKDSGHDAEEDSDPGTEEEEEEEEEEENDHRKLGGQSRRRTPKPFPTPSQQYADARILARRRVYDMQYLRDDRLWGPYQVVTRVPIKTPGASRPGDDRVGKSQEDGKDASASGDVPGRGWIHRLGTLAWSMGAEIEPDEFDSDPTSDDSEDEDWHDPADHGQTSFAPFGSEDREPEQTIGTKDTVDADMEMDTEPTEPEHPLISLILASAVTADVEPTSDPTSTSSRRRTRRSNPRLRPNYSVSPREIKPHHLRPDYAFLASARIVVEANLKELFGKEISDDVPQPASEIRAGGVGTFWEDEDEILRTRVGSSELVSSFSPVSSSTATAPSGISADSTNPSALELADILSQFQNLEVARLGSTCGYWSGWIEGQQTAKRGFDKGADAAPSSLEGNIGSRNTRIVKQPHQLEKPIGVTSTTEYKGKGKGKDSKKSASVPALGAGDWRFGSEGEACEGWDWAGVAGIWKRCVCWMDYRELLFFNLDSTKFLTLGTQEACRIIPMELRITGYTRAGLMPVYDTDDRDNINVLSPDNRRHKAGVCTGYFRPPPIIHFSGAAVGSDRGMEDGRKVKGMVQLIGGGEVRWQMDTYTQESGLSESSTPEWSSEAVQVGGIGSAVGVLGMWTGAEHERADPLGPFWAWKVV